MTGMKNNNIITALKNNLKKKFKKAYPDAYLPHCEGKIERVAEQPQVGEWNPQEVKAVSGYYGQDRIIP